MALSPAPRKLSSSQITLAAKSFAAAQFALSGFDVLEQTTGHSRVFFDMAVASSGGMMKVSVHASFNGFWDLVDRYLNPAPRTGATAAEYHRAIERWAEHASASVTCCLVEFEADRLEHMPHIYLVSRGEMAAKLHAMIEQLAQDALAPLGFDVVQRLEGLPQAWRFSGRRIADLMN